MQNRITTKSQRNHNKSTKTKTHAQARLVVGFVCGHTLCRKTAALVHFLLMCSPRENVRSTYQVPGTIVFDWYQPERVNFDEILDLAADVLTF